MKVRGYRVELGEIETTLGQHPAIREAVVVARKEGLGEVCLVAYVVARRASTPTDSELRHWLREKLPVYMVPSAFMRLDALPLTASGKIDRLALPIPSQGGPELDKAFAAPHTPTEEVLAGIWTTVLGVEEVGVHDNFFDLGGHSLLAVQVMSRLREAVQMEVPLCALFEAPTIASLAFSLEIAREAEQPVRLRPYSPGHQGKRHLPPLRRNTSGFSTGYSAACPCLTSLMLCVWGALHTAALEQSFNEIIRRHEALRTTFATVEGQLVQVIAPTVHMPLTVRDLSGLPETEREDEARRLIQEDSQRPFDLVRAPLTGLLATAQRAGAPPTRDATPHHLRRLVARCTRA